MAEGLRGGQAAPGHSGPRVLVCDDHPLVRSAIASAMEETFDGPVEVARDFQEAWSLAEGGFDLCLVDLGMPGATPYDGISGLQARAAGGKVIVVTGSECDEDLRVALDLRVEGFVPKSTDSDVFDAAVRLVMAGGRFLPPRVAALAFGAPSAPPGSAPLPPSLAAEPLEVAEGPYGRLSARQRQILCRMADGLANKTIARDLGLSPATVKTHVAHVIAVLGAANRTEAAARARHLGLI